MGEFRIQNPLGLAPALTRSLFRMARERPKDSRLSKGIRNSRATASRESFSFDTNAPLRAGEDRRALVATIRGRRRAQHVWYDADVDARAAHASR